MMFLLVLVMPCGLEKQEPGSGAAAFITTDPSSSRAGMNTSILLGTRQG